MKKPESNVPAERELVELLAFRAASSNISRLLLASVAEAVRDAIEHPELGMSTLAARLHNLRSFDAHEFERLSLAVRAVVTTVEIVGGAR